MMTARPVATGRPYSSFIDWMKAIGISLIVMGHVAGRPTNYWTPPIFPKQLGVAFFVFVLGYSLASDTRRLPAPRLVFRRLFEIGVFGFGFAIVMSLISLALRGSLQLSNYMPLVLGANVLVDDFPANPTTWYIGTYSHIVLLWAFLLVSAPISRGWLIVAVPLEIAVRVVLAQTAGGHVAYMLFTNWMTVFLAGVLAARRGGGPRRKAHYALALVAWLFVWPLALNRLVVASPPPFMTLAGGLAGSVFGSCCVSALYLGITWLVFRITWEAAAGVVVRFLARNTLIIFIVHMPLYWGLDALLLEHAYGWWARSAVHLLVSLVGLGLASELVRRLVNVKRWERVIEGRVWPEPAAMAGRVG